MKIYKIILCILTVFNISFFSFTGLSQEEASETMPFSAVIPPNPEAASFDYFSEVKIGKFTGSADISIPLFNLQSKQLSTSVSLRYQSAGLKVRQKASWVGKGWNLNAMGVITRTVKGMADDLEGNREHYGIDVDPGELTVEECNSDEAEPWRTLNAIASNCEDIEFDVFSYSLPSGESGKFIFDHRNWPRLLTPKNIKIVPVYGLQSGVLQHFEITTSDGTLYTFNYPEYTKIDDFCANMIFDPISTPCYNLAESYISSWYLSKIENANKTDEIIFEYKSETYTHQQPIYDLTSELVEESPINNLSAPNACVSTLTVIKSLAQMDMNSGLSKAARIALTFQELEG